LGYQSEIIDCTHSLVRLRTELEKLLMNESSKVSDPAKKSAYLVTHYEEILQELAVSYAPLLYRDYEN
jgi:hypothetical protein